MGEVLDFPRVLCGNLVPLSGTTKALQVALFLLESSTSCCIAVSIPYRGAYAGLLTNYTLDLRQLLGQQPVVPGAYVVDHLALAALLLDRGLE